MQYMDDVEVIQDPVKEMFDAIDEDGSGEIDIDEFKEGCKRLQINFPEVRNPNPESQTMIRTLQIPNFES